MDKTGHREPLRGVLYNGTFHVAVSVDEGGTVCVWRMQVDWRPRAAAIAGRRACGAWSVPPPACVADASAAQGARDPQPPRFGRTARATGALATRTAAAR